MHEKNLTQITGYRYFQACCMYYRRNGKSILGVTITDVGASKGRGGIGIKVCDVGITAS